MATEHLDLVLTRESKDADHAVKIWRGIHTWNFTVGAVHRGVRSSAGGGAAAEIGVG